MNNVTLALDAAWKVLLAGLVLGAGLPALFAVGIRSMAYGTGGAAELDHSGPHPIGRIGGYLCFALVLAAIALGITFIVASGFGKQLSFEHVYPVIQDKKH